MSSRKYLISVNYYISLYFYDNYKCIVIVNKEKIFISEIFGAIFCENIVKSTLNFSYSSDSKTKSNHVLFSMKMATCILFCIPATQISQFPVDIVYK